MQKNIVWMNILCGPYERIRTYINIIVSRIRLFLGGIYSTYVKPPIYYCSIIQTYN